MLVSTGVILLLATLSYLLIVYRFREVLKLVVEIESKGKYEAEAGNISLSVWKNKITISNLSVFPTDTSDAHTHYKVDVKEIFVSIQSLRDLLFDKKAVVNRLIISNPSVDIHVHGKSESEESMTFRASDIIRVLKNVSGHLQVKELIISDGALNYRSLQHPEPFHVDKIGLRILNFKEKERVENDLMYTDEIEITISDQSWTLPGGRQDVSFQRLRFSARDQSIRVDSCKLVMRGVPGADTISLMAHQLRFTPRQLYGHLNHDELVVDSIILDQPLLVLHKGSHKRSDSARSVSAALNQLFTRVNFRYVDIDDGAFRIYEVQKPDPVYTTETMDVEVFNMNASSANAAGFSFDSVRLKLNELKFITRDSLYQLTVQEFGLKQNDLIFLNARFGNAPGNVNANSMSFSTPALRFRQIDIEALMNKQLKAPYIEVLQPSINLFTRGRRHADNDSAEKFSPKDFYKVLNGFDELVDVDSFHIQNGKLSLRSVNNKIQADADNIDGIILINRLIESDSLIDVKKAIPALTIAHASFRNDKLLMKAEGFQFNGLLKHTLIDNLEFASSTGSFFKANEVFWDQLDWDLLQMKKAIRLKRISLGQMTAHFRQSPGSRHAPIPKLDLGSLAVADLDLKLSGNDKLISFSGENIGAKDLTNHNKHLNWTSLLGTLRDVVYDTKAVNARFGTAAISSLRGIDLSNVNLSIQNDISFDAPGLQVIGQFNSTDFTNAILDSIKSDTSTLIIQQKARKTGVENNATSGKIITASTQHQVKPVSNLLARSVQLLNTAVKYESAENLAVTGISDISASQLVFGDATSPATKFDRLLIDVRNTRVTKDLVYISIPQLQLDLNQGAISSDSGKTRINTNISAGWTHLGASFTDTDSLGLRLDSLSGDFNQNNFYFTAGNPLNWQSLAAFATITGGNVSYNTKQLASFARHLEWSGDSMMLNTGSFSMAHHADPASWFASEQWQKDHLDFKGNAIRATGIRLPENAAGKPLADSGIFISSIGINGVEITATRDKRMPFQHGIEKLMPTSLLRTLKRPVRIDTINISDGGVNVQEISARNGKLAKVPITRLNARILGFTNRPDPNESLIIEAFGELVTNRIDHIQYIEAYDSLSPFEMRINVAPMTLTTFTEITRPLASVNVTSGNSDTLHAYWTGNKYAAGGLMNFSYRDLKVVIQDEKKKSGKRFMTFLANTILRNKNRRETAVFYVRNREKFVFNYWVKTSMSGLMTSVGVKRSRKYYRKYNKVKEKYSLPDFPATRKIIPGISNLATQ